MGFFDAIKKLFSSGFSKQSTKYTPDLPPYQGDYAKAVFLNAYAKASPIKNDNEYQQYIKYECGIANPSEFHRSLVNEGFLAPTPACDKLKTLKVAELKTILSEMGLSEKGKKEDIINRILETQNFDVIKKYFPQDVYSITELGQKFLDEHYDYVMIHKHKKWGVTWQEYDALKQPELSYYDVMWRIFNQRVTCGVSTGDYGRNAYLCMYELLVEEKRRTDALEMLLRVIYIDVSGVYALRYLKYAPSVNKTYIDELFVSAVMLAPGLINDIVKYSDIYDDSIIDTIYKYRLPIQACDKKTFARIVHMALNDEYSEPMAMEILRPGYNVAMKQYLKSR